MSDDTETKSLSERTLSEVCGGGMVIDAAVVAKVMDDEGTVTIHHTRSSDSNIFEIMGMLTVYLDSLRAHCQTDTCPHCDDDDDDECEVA